MAESMRLRLTDDRQLLLDRIYAELEQRGADLPDQRWKADVLDMALAHFKESLENHAEFDGDPRVAKAFSTSVIQSKYRTWVDVNRV